MTKKIKKFVPTDEPMNFRYTISDSVFYMIGTRTINRLNVVMEALIDLNEYVYDYEDLILAFYPSVEHFEKIFRTEKLRRNALCDCIFYYYNDWKREVFKNQKLANTHVRIKRVALEEKADTLFAHARSISFN